MGIVGAVIGGVMGVVGGVKSAGKTKKANKQIGKANNFARLKAQIQGIRQKEEVVRNTRRQYADVIQAAENQGVASSSAAQGGQSSILAQMKNNLSFLDQFGTLSDKESEALGKAQQYSNQANMWSSISNLGFNLFSTSMQTMSAAGGGGG